MRDIEGKVREKGSQPALHTDGRVSSRWVVLDFVDVMIHVLDGEMREHYALEDLWGDAKEVPFKSASDTSDED